MSICIYSDQETVIADIRTLLMLHAPKLLLFHAKPVHCFTPDVFQTNEQSAILDLTEWNMLPTFISYQVKAAKNAIFYHQSPTLELTLEMMRRNLTQLLTPPVNVFRLLCYLDIEPTENGMRLLTGEVRAYINQHFMEPVSAAELAERFHINACRLSTLFKKYEQEGLNRYLTLCRLAHAKELLLSTGKSIPEIAACSGFSCSKYFAAVFKDSEGISPDTFRKGTKSGKSL